MPIKDIPTEDVRGLILDLIINAPPEISGGFYDGKKTARAIRDLPISIAYIIGMRRIGKTELFTWV